MRIAFFADNFLPQINGAVTATINLIKGLADKGHKIYVIAPRYPKAEEFSYKNIFVKRIPGVPAFFYPDLRITSPFSKSIIKYLKNNKIELIHFNAPMSLGILAIISSRILKVPLVSTFHTFFGDQKYLKHAGLNFKIFGKISWCYARRLFNYSNLISCPSDITKKEMIAHGIKSNILAISNGIEENAFNNSKKEKIRLKYNPNGPILLFVGRISYEKNIPYLIDCFKIVLKKIPNAKLLIIGDGPQLRDLNRKIIFDSLSEKVLLLGSIPRDVLIKSSIYGASDIFVTASTTETQGITILEAQINGLVCIGINRGGVKELIKNNYNGYLVKEENKKAFAEAVIKLLSKKDLYKKMQKNTLKEIEKHKLGKVIDIWEEEYKKLISK